MLSGFHPVAEATVLAIIGTTDTTTPLFPVQAAKLTPTSQEIFVFPVLQVLHLQRTQQAAVVEQVSTGLAGNVHSVQRIRTVRKGTQLVPPVQQTQNLLQDRRIVTARPEDTGRMGIVLSVQQIPIARQDQSSAPPAPPGRLLTPGLQCALVQLASTG